MNYYCQESFWNQQDLDNHQFEPEELDREQEYYDEEVEVDEVLESIDKFVDLNAYSSKLKCKHCIFQKITFPNV